MSKKGDSHIDWKSLMSEVYRDPHAICAILFSAKDPLKKERARPHKCAMQIKEV